MSKHPPGNYNPKDSKGRFTSGKQYNDEPNKDRDIARSKAQADEKNGRKELSVINSEELNQEVLSQSLQKLKEIQEELPQVEELIKKYNGQGTIIKAEGFLPGETVHTSATADGDTDPKTGTIGLNTAMLLSKRNGIEQIQRSSEKAGTFRERFGTKDRNLSSTDVRHTLIHEYGHIIQLALCCKYSPKRILGDYTTRDTVADMLTIACHRTGTTIKEFQKSLSSYASKHLGETFSEAIANAILAPQENNKTSLELWKMVKKELS